MAASRTTKRVKAAPETPVAEVEKVEPVQDEPVVVPEKKDVIRIKEISLGDYVTVRNGFTGKLIYKSRKTGERFVWEAFGDEQDMELQELKNAKNSYKVFFENGWFLIDDPDVISALGLERYYVNALSYKEFDELFAMTPVQIEERISKLSDGQKRTVLYRARDLIRDGEIDSLKTIAAIERGLGRELIEH